MAIEDTESVDIVSVERSTGLVVVSLIDSMDWSEDTEQHHLELLEKKLNAYLRFIESGEIAEWVSDASGRGIVISACFKHQPTVRALRILASARAIIEEAGFSLRLSGPGGAW